MSIRRRLSHAFASLSFGYAVAVGIQILSVPVLLHAWGGALYGEWLIASTIPGYLAMSDLGLNSALANDMALAEARGDRAACVAAFQSVGVAIFAIGVLLIGIMALAGWYLPLQDLLGTKLLAGRELAMLIVLLVAQVWLAQMLGVVSAGFRCVGQYPFGNFYGNCVRLAEYAALLTSAASGDGVIFSTAAMVLVRAVGTVGFAVILRFKVPWLKFGVVNFQLEPLRRLLAVGVTFLSLPVSTALNLQTPILVLGHMVGAEAVVVFATCRTVSRAVYQLFSIINNTVWPELTRAYGARDFAVLKRLYRITVTASIWTGVAGAAALAIWGPALYRLWTSRIVALDPLVLDILLLVMLANVAWSPAFIVQAATNRISEFARWFLAANVALVPLCWAFTKFAGVRGAAASLLLVELAVSFRVIPASSRLVRDHPRRLLKYLFNPVAFAQLLGPTPWDLLMPRRGRKPATRPPFETMPD